MSRPVDALGEEVAITADDATSWRDRVPSPNAAASFGVLAVPVVVVALLGWQRRWMADDAFINVRVVHNLFEGHGPVFNVGERVEVGTSTLWLFVLSVGHVVLPFVSVELFAVIAGLVATVAGLMFATSGAASLWRAQGQRGLAVPVGTVIVAALPPFWDYATGGLESGLTTLWLGASFWLLVRRLRMQSRRDAPDPRPAWRPVLPALVIGLGPLVRPDLVLIAAALGIALLVQSERSWRSWVGGAVAALALPVSYEVFRAGYYASLVPNTALAKSAGSSLVSQGLVYLGDFAGRYVLIVPLAVALGLFVVPLLLVMQRGRRWSEMALVIAPIAGGLLHAAFVVRIGGDFMHGRLLLPATFSILLPVAAIVAGRGSILRPYPLVPLAGVVVWALFIGTSVRVPYVDVTGDGIANERAWHVSQAKTLHPIHPEDYDTQLPWYGWGTVARDAAARGDRSFVDLTGQWPSADGFGYVFRLGTIGMLGVRAGSKVYIDDSYSLANPIGARLEIPFGRDSIVGHAHIVPIAWDRARFARPDPSDPPDVIAARQALGCGEVHELIKDITAPLSIGRFLGNIVDSPRLTHFRIPLDPHAAAKQLCS